MGKGVIFAPGVSCLAGWPGRTGRGVGGQGLVGSELLEVEEIIVGGGSVGFEGAELLLLLLLFGRDDDAVAVD